MEGDALYSHDGDFEHRRFVDCLHELDAKWCVSYTDLPPGLEKYRIVEREAAQHMASAPKTPTRTERLVMNYDITDTAVHSRYDQAGLSEYW